MRTRTSLCGVPKIEGGFESSFNIFGIFLLKGVSLGGLGEVDLNQRKIGDGSGIYLWLENWHPDGILSDKFGFRIVYEACVRSSQVKFSRWNPPAKNQNFLLNTDASFSKGHFILGYAVFDHRGVHLLRRAKVIKVEERSGYPVLEAEARALELALVELKDRGWLPVMVQCDSLNLIYMLDENLSSDDKSVDDIISRCKHLLEHNHMKAVWVAREANKLADYLVECAKWDHMNVCDTDLDPELCRKTWAEMFGHIRPHLSRTSYISKGRHKYLLSKQDGPAQILLTWINMALNKKKMPTEIIFEISTTEGVRLVERYLISISSANKKIKYPLREDDVMHRLIDIFDHLKPLPVPRTLLMYVQFDTEIELMPNDLFESCSSKELTIWSNPKHFYFNTGAIKFGNHVLTVRVISHYAPGLCIRRLNFGPHKNYRGKDIRSTIMGWFHHQTMDDFKIIDILNEITCKNVEEIEATLMEFVKEGIVIEVEPNLYVIQRKHLPQPINDFTIEDLKSEGRKENESIRYNYKVVEGIAFEGSFTF